GARGADHGSLAGARGPGRGGTPGAPRARAAGPDRAAQGGPAPRDAHPRRLASEEGAVSSPEPTKIDVQERGANQQTSDRRLYMQLQVFGGCLDPKPLVGAVESRRIEAALYQDVNDPRGFGVLAMSEDPAFFVNGLRELLNADPFATGLDGRDLPPLSHRVQAMRKTAQASQYIQTLGPFFVGHALWQSPLAGPGGPARR